MTEDIMTQFANAITVIEPCAACDAVGEVEINTLSGEIECMSCGATDVLGQHELLNVLMNLED
jgi:hypothetical protein